VGHWKKASSQFAAAMKKERGQIFAEPEKNTFPVVRKRMPAIRKQPAGKKKRGKKGKDWQHRPKRSLEEKKREHLPVHPARGWEGKGKKKKKQRGPQEIGHLELAPITEREKSKKEKVRWTRAAR